MPANHFADTVADDDGIQVNRWGQYDYTATRLADGLTGNGTTADAARRDLAHVIAEEARTR